MAAKAKHPNDADPFSAVCPTCGYSVASADVELNKAMVAEHIESAHSKKKKKS